VIIIAVMTTSMIAVTFAPVAATITVIVAATFHSDDTVHYTNA